MHQVAALQLTVISDSQGQCSLFRAQNGAGWLCTINTPLRSRCIRGDHQYTIVHQMHDGAPSFCMSNRMHSSERKCNIRAAHNGAPSMHQVHRVHQ